ncbi:MAG: hypothetical protein IJV22_03655 [Bacteroidales bacterium]|nr:hypothetical protein [Bacteroidales bacterium]
MKNKSAKLSALLAGVLLLGATTACNDDKKEGPTPPEQLSEEVYAGGLLGTTFNVSASAFEDPTPAVEIAGLMNEFKYGEYFFERPITQTNKPFNGLGPVYIRNSCIACHPGYGHGKRMERYNADDWGNGYLLVVTDPQDRYIYSLAGMPQTRAVAPFKAPIDDSNIDIQWLTETDEWGNKFDDGETYELTYPEVTIPEEAYYVPLIDKDGNTVPYANVKVRLESTIGIYGTGLIDAIPDDSLKAQYQKEAAAGVQLNPEMWAGNDWAASGYYGKTKHPKRYTYALTRGPLQDAPGANAIWNITNVIRPTKRSHYLDLNGTIYATVSSQDADVKAGFYDYLRTYCPTFTTTGDTARDIYNYLTCDTLPIEMSGDDYNNFMVWHRGLAVPAARNMTDSDVQRGKKLFTELGCAYCHRPSWTTGDDNFTDPTGFYQDGDSRLPRYPNQKIWPYSDFVQHKLYMKNDIRTGWCRTTPLWGRGLSQICTGASERLHDCRARNVIEAIMWHGWSRQSDAYESVVKFRKLNKADRDAVVKFINSI